MKLHHLGGFAALTCAATYLIGFAILVTVLAPLGFGSGTIDTGAVVGFIAETPGFFIWWNTTIYIVNALALALLVVALHRHLDPFAPEAAAVTRTLGTIWATLVLGAGMIANVAVEEVHALAHDPEAAGALWEVLRAVELGLGGGNEIAGGAWILAVSLAGWGALPRSMNWLGLLVGLSGLATILPPLGEITGVIFGLGAIVWFLVAGGALLRPRASAAPR